MAHMEQFSCLLVDDDVGFTSMLAKLVVEEGGTSVASHTIDGAVAQVARRSFDLVILDNGLPDGTGYDFYPHLIRRSRMSHFRRATASLVVNAASLTSP